MVSELPTEPLHIGIVGCSAEGAALCYRTICSQGSRVLGAHAHPQVSMHTHSLARYVECLNGDDAVAGVGALMLSSAANLAGAGADFLICPDNTIHQAFDHVAARSPLPWLHIADVLADEAAVRGFRRVGILGTPWLMNSEVYPPRLRARGIEWRLPPAGAQARIGHIIMDELVAGRFEPRSIAELRDLVDGLRRQGCDAVALACTELPLVLDDRNSPLPTLDSTRLLALAALRRAVDPR